LYTHPALRTLHSSPTRRSSDLSRVSSRPSVTAVGPTYFPKSPASCQPPARSRRSPAEWCVSPWRTNASARWQGPCEMPLILSLRSEEHTSELQSRENLVCRRLL